MLRPVPPENAGVVGPLLTPLGLQTEKCIAQHGSVSLPAGRVESG